MAHDFEQVDEAGQPLPARSNYVATPFAIYLLGIFIRPESLIRQGGYFHPPWRMTFYNLAFSTIYTLVRSRLPGLIAPEEKSDVYAAFHVTDPDDITLCRLVIRAVAGSSPTGTPARIELLAAAPAATPATMHVLYGVLQGISDELGNQGTMRITHDTRAPRGQEAAHADVSQAQPAQSEGSRSGNAFFDPYDTAYAALKTGTSRKTVFANYLQAAYSTIDKNDKAQVEQIRRNFNEAMRRRKSHEKATP